MDATAALLPRRLSFTHSRASRSRGRSTEARSRLVRRISPFPTGIGIDNIYAVRIRFLALCLSFGLVGCLDPQPPILFVPTATSLPEGNSLSIASDALTRQGFQILPPNHESGALATEWVYRDDWYGRTRHRALVRLSRGPAAGLAVSVPVEILVDEHWEPNGEDEETRQRVVAAIVARLQAAGRSVR